MPSGIHADADTLTKREQPQSARKGRKQHCKVCGCNVGAGPQSWQTHVDGIQHRRKALSLQHTGSADHHITSAFEDLQGVSFNSRTCIRNIVKLITIFAIHVPGQDCLWVRRNVLRQSKNWATAGACVANNVIPDVVADWTGCCVPSEPLPALCTAKDFLTRQMPEWLSWKASRH